MLERLKRYPEAIDNYKITLSLDDPSSFAYLRIAICYEKIGERSTAEQYYFKAVHEDPQSSKAWLALVDYYAREDDYEKAQKYVSKVLINEGDNPSYLKRCAEIYAHVGAYSEAIQIYQQAIELGDYSVEIRNELTDLLLLEEHYQQALIQALSTLQLYPAEAIPYYQTAVAYFYLEQPTEKNFYLSVAMDKAREWLPHFEKKYPKVFSNHTQELSKNTNY